MFTFSKVHNWQDDSAVKQIRVFSSEEMKKIFDAEYAVRVAQYGTCIAGDSDIGAIYKLRAVKDSNDTWIPIIRCGFMGTKLWEGVGCDNVTLALASCANHLGLNITNILWDYSKGR
jgi:hypothetical protein